LNPNPNKEALGVIKKFTKLCGEDPQFEERFMIFFENLLIDYRNSNLSGQEMDDQLYDYLQTYTMKKRENRIKSILKEKK
jgi:hypothetical protein